MPSLPNANKTPRQIYSVSKLTHSIKSLLEDNYRIIWLSGEISNIRIPASGHAYFTLKDERSQISAVMFKGQLRQLKFDLENGAVIVGLGRISVYEPRGTYQIILEYVEPQGAGALQIAFEQLKRKLEQEGLFQASHKQSLPFLPEKIGVITSPTGAVVKDILRVIGRRYPSMAVDIIPVRVQGADAVPEIIEALSIANTDSQCDLIILARGGGSFEDMAPFNNESVARAVFASQKPVVSAIGHETDFTILDFVADLRAPTPSAAAEMVVPVQAELADKCQEMIRRCRRSIRRAVEGQRQRVDEIHNKFPLLTRRLQDYQMHCDALVEQLFRALKYFRQRQMGEYDKLFNRLLSNKPDRYIALLQSKLELWMHRFKESMRKGQMHQQQRLKMLEASLSALNPTAILMRGYSITRTLPQRKIVSNENQVKEKDTLEIQLANGKIEVTVHKKTPNK